MIAFKKLQDFSIIFYKMLVTVYCKEASYSSSLNLSMVLDQKYLCVLGNLFKHANSQVLPKIYLDRVWVWTL